MRSHGQLPQERQLYWDILQHVAAGQQLARATLIHAWGSTPREVGAKMLVYADGSIRGTVGGGCGEAEVWQEAMAALEEGTPRRVEVDLTEDESSDNGKVCGGRFEVFIDLWGPSHPLREPLTQALEQEAAALLVTDLGSVPVRLWRKQPVEFAEPSTPGGTRLLLQDDQHFWSRAMPSGRPSVAVVDGREYFLDPLVFGLELVIAGAGHIARPLCAMAALCGYSVTVLDDRPEYADAEFFPAATRVVCAPFDEFFASYGCHAQSHVVLVTRGHKYDEMCLRALVGQSLAYVGMIGSRRRTRAVMEDLRAEGAQGGWLQRVHAPVGLDVGALTPEEIAVSILAELILVRRGGKGGSLKLQMEL